MNLENLKILIVEDEVIIAESIKLYLSQFGCENIRMKHDLSSSLDCINSWSPAVVLLDIHLENDDDGIKIGTFLNDKKIPFMYITANTDNTTTQRVLQTQPTGFIAKPIRLNEFKINLHMLVNEFEKGGKRRLTLSNGSESIQFNESQLKYLMSDGNYVEVHLDENRHIIRNTLEKCLEELQSENFIRIHRSYVVPTERVSSFSANSIIVDGDELPVSRSYQASVKLALKNKNI